MIRYSNKIIIPHILTEESVFFVQQETSRTSSETKILLTVRDIAENPMCCHAVQNGSSINCVLSELIFLINTLPLVKPKKVQMINVTKTNEVHIIRENKTAPISFEILLPFLPIRQVNGICSIPCSLSPAKTEDRTHIKKLIQEYKAAQSCKA